MKLCFVVGVLVVSWWAEPAVRAQVVMRDVTEEAGLRPVVAGALNHGLAWGDVDGDGRLDLFLGNFNDRPGEARDNGLFRQAADGSFTPLPMPSLARPGRTSGALLADLDNDGDLDLYVSNNTHERASQRPAQNEPSALYRNDGGRFVDVSNESGAVLAGAAFGRDVIALDYDGDGLLDLLICEDRVFRPAGHSKLLRNLGGLKFEDATAEAGLPRDIDAFGAAVGDVNGDGRPDVYFTSCNRLYLSNGRGGYIEAESLRSLFELKGMDKEDYTTSAILADIDNDGDLDLLVGLHHVPSRVRVYLNDGLKDGVPQFRDATKELGIPVLPNKAATCDVGDFDNDGWPDLYWSCWFVEGEKGELRRAFICRGLGVKDGRPAFEVPSVEGIGLNKKNLVAPGQRTMVYYVNGPAVDYDGDGRLDVFAGIWPTEDSKLLHNETKNANHWLEVSVRGDGRVLNRMGIGAKVRVSAGGKLFGFREIGVCGGYSGTRAAIAHFGLGAVDSVDVEIEVPGRSERIKRTGVKVDALLKVEQ